MTREQCKKRIRDSMIRIDKVYHDYNPEGTYLSLRIVGDFVRVNNSDDADHPLNMFYRIEGKRHEH